MEFKTIITYIDIDSGEVLNITGEDFKKNYDFSKRRDKSIFKDDYCTIIYIYEGSKKKQIEINFNNNQNSL